MKQDGSSAVRLLVLLALLAVVAGGTYLKNPAARQMVDQKLPFVKDTLGRFGAAPAPLEPADSGAPAAEGTPTNGAAPVMTFEKVAADPTSWPRTVRLTKEVEVPAVVAGKVSGKVLVKAGTEVNVARIKDGNVGIEYQGGGAWVKPSDTDLMTRVRPPAPAPAPAP